MLKTNKENPYLEGKKVRMQRLREIIRDVDEKGIDHKKLTAIAAWDLGIKEKTLNSYLETLLTMGFVEWDASNKVWKAVPNS